MLRRIIACPLKIKLLTLFSVTCFILLFVGGPDYYSIRSYKYAWSLGHIFCFLAWTSILILSWKRIASKSFYQQCLWIISISFIVGIATELAQGIFGRTSSMDDFIRNITGGIVTLLFISPARKTSKKYILRIIQAAVIVMILIEVLPLAIALTDEAIAREQFPVLADFETPFEGKRWSAETDIVRYRSLAASGEFSLKVQLDTTKYSGIGLKYFNGDWRKYNSLKFSVFNLSPNDLKIHCRIHDWQHILKGEQYNDRFNHEYFLAKGWNDIEIYFDLIIDAPDGRKMDMGHIKGFGVFAVSLPKPLVIYIDNVRLIE